MTGHVRAATRSGRLENQATEAKPDRRRRHNRVDKLRPVHPKRSKVIHESHVCRGDDALSCQLAPAGHYKHIHAI